MFERYYTVNDATGVQITLLPDGGAVIHACSVTVKDHTLNIEKKLAGISMEQLPPKSVIALNLSGKVVLQKQLEKTDAIDQHNFSKILPNAHIGDFYVQHFTSGGSSFVSVIRKAEADKWIAQLEDRGCMPVMLSLGPFPVQNVSAQLNVYDSRVIFNGWIIERNEQLDWMSCRYDVSAESPFPLKIESERIDEKLLVPYAAAFQLVLAGKLDPVQADVPALDKAFRSLLAEKKLKVQGSIILCVFFVLLLANFLLFSWLNSANARLTEQVSRSVQSTEDVQKINEETGQKENLLKTLGWEAGINKSALVDQVAALLPPELTWKEVAVDPADLSGSPTQKSITFANRCIRITGESAKIIPVNEWVARVKSRPWVKNVQLERYTFNNELNTGEFTILINY